MQDRQLNYEMKDPVEVNLSYMPFIVGGGLFVPTPEKFILNERIIVNVKLPNQEEAILIEGKIIWITPSNALHHVLSGVGIQFIGNQTQSIREKIEASLNKNMEIGGYTYGMMDK